MPDSIADTSRFTTMIGESPAFLGMLEQASRVAAVDKPVLVIGERGTGKELIAARLHYLSPRWDCPLVKLNCATLTESLLETELFGHEAGAFTGATRRHVGRFELADGGTLFLDELAHVSLRMQEKILRAVEYGQFERVGSNDTVSVNVRIVGATNQDLPAAVRAGRFRADLLDRLAFDVVTIPPLRARTLDILRLAEHFAIGISQELERDLFAGFTERARESLLHYEWPGNVRELKNVIERSVHRAPSDKPVDEIVLDPFASAFRLGTTDSDPLASAFQLGAASSDPFASEFRPGAAGSTPLASAFRPGAASSDSSASAIRPGATHSDPLASAFRSAADQAREPAPTTPPATTTHPAIRMPCDLKAEIAKLETRLIDQALTEARHNQTEAAPLLGLTYHQLRALLRKHGLIKPQVASRRDG